MLDSSVLMRILDASILMFLVAQISQYIRFIIAFCSHINIGCAVIHIRWNIPSFWHTSLTLGAGSPVLILNTLSIRIDPPNKLCLVEFLYLSWGILWLVTWIRLVPHNLIISSDWFTACSEWPVKTFFRFKTFAFMRLSRTSVPERIPINTIIIISGGLVQKNAASKRRLGIRVVQRGIWVLRLCFVVI